MYNVALHVFAIVGVLVALAVSGLALGCLWCHWFAKAVLRHRALKEKLTGASKHSSAPTP